MPPTGRNMLSVTAFPLHRQKLGMIWNQVAHYSSIFAATSLLHSRTSKTEVALNYLEHMAVLT